MFAELGRESQQGGVGVGEELIVVYAGSATGLFEDFGGCRVAKSSALGDDEDGLGEI